MLYPQFTFSLYPLPSIPIPDSSSSIPALILYIYHFSSFLIDLFLRVGSLSIYWHSHLPAWELKWRERISPNIPNQILGNSSDWSTLIHIVILEPIIMIKPAKTQDWIIKSASHRSEILPNSSFTKISRVQAIKRQRQSRERSGTSLPGPSYPPAQNKDRSFTEKS